MSLDVDHGGTPTSTEAASSAGTSRMLRRSWLDAATVRWLLARLSMSLVAVFVVMSTVFWVTRAVSDPARHMLPVGASQEQVEAFNAKLGLDQPRLEQYWHFLVDLTRFDLGESVWEHRPALQVALDRLPGTLQLLGLALLISIVVFVPLGVFASTRPGSIVDRVVTGLSLAGLSMPQFWLGAMLVLVFSLAIPIFPTSGSGTFAHAILPAVTLAFSIGGRMAQVARTSFLEQARMPYVTQARAKGFSGGYVLRKHVLRNAFLPILTIASWDTARAITGHAVVVEVVFAWPGFGRLVIESVQRSDYTVIQACVFVGAIVIVVLNLLTDVLSRIVEPRVGLS